MRDRTAADHPRSSPPLQVRGAEREHTRRPNGEHPRGHERNHGRGDEEREFEGE
jgi:hypothetical protein